MFLRLADVRLLQRLFARLCGRSHSGAAEGKSGQVARNTSCVMPRAQIESLTALNLVNPAREGLVDFRIGGTEGSQFHIHSVRSYFQFGRLGRSKNSYDRAVLTRHSEGTFGL